MALDNRLVVYNEQGEPVDYDILASDVKFLPDGKDLPTKLAELEDEIGQGGYAPPQGGIPKTDLAQSVQDSLDKADSALQDEDVAEVAKTGDYDDLQNKPTIPDTSNLATKTELATKQDKLSAGNGIVIGNDGKTVSVAEAIRTGAAAGATAVQSVSVNNNPVTPDGNGNVNIEVQTGGETKEISILFVGNSLTQDAVSYLPLVLSELCPTLSYKFYIWYDGGYTLTQILSKWNNGGKAEIFSVCENGTSWTNYNNSKTIADILSSYTFDVVCLEEYFNYKRANGYTTEDKQVFNDIITYIRGHYNKPFKVVSFFHRPLVKDANNNPDMSIADEVFGLTYDGVRWQLENTISEDVIPTGIAAYRAMYNSVLNGLGDFGYMSPDGTHGQEGLPCLMQAWVTTLWIVNRLGIPVSINNIQGRVTSANYSSINVPGPNLGNGLVVGTSAQDKEAMNVAIQAYKEGMKMVERFISPRGVPAYKIEVAGADGTHTERFVQLSASLLPSDAEGNGITWSVVSGDATVNANGLVNYTGTARVASVVVRAVLSGKSIKTDVTLAFSLAAVETPIFTPAAGQIVAGQSVAISCATTGATIYYTTDGSTPTASSTQYTEPIVVNASITIKAIAILGNESSNVATAEYIEAQPVTVTVTITDGENAVEGAAVSLSADGIDHAPTSQSGGTYVFMVLHGTYGLNIRKTGFIPYTETITALGNISKSVELRSTDLLRYALVGNPGCMGTSKPTKPLYPVIMQTTDSTTPTIGAYLQVFDGNNRCGVLVQRDKAEMPVTWQAWGDGDNIHGGSTLVEARGMYSLVEWPLDVPEIEIRMTNPNYYMDGRIMSQSNGDFYRYGGAWVQGGNSCVFNINRNDHPNAFYVGIWFKYQSAGTTWANTSIEGLGLSVTAIVD